MLSNMSDKELRFRLDISEHKLLQARDLEEQKLWNGIFQKLFDEQVRRDMLQESGAKQ